MKNAKELEELFDITAEEIADIDADACKGVLHGRAAKTATGPGRPPLYNEPMRQVAFKEPDHRVQAIDRRAAQLGMGRSEYLRQLVENDLACAGMA